MDGTELLAERFEEQRPRLRAMAYRMLGSLSEADDAVQEGWLRLARSEAAEIENLAGWLTTVVGRVCLDMLRSRAARREEPLDLRIPDPVLSPIDGTADPEHQALLADAVGLALQVVIDTLSPAERLAFVLHDMFAVPFDDIAPLLGRSTDATKMLASRARRRVRGASPVPDPDAARQRAVVDAFLAAAQAGDLDALLAVLDPDVLVRADGGTAGPASRLLRGAREVAASALAFHDPSVESRLVLVNGAPGLVNVRDGRPTTILSFTVSGGRIVEIDILADPDRVPALFGG